MPPSGPAGGGWNHGLAAGKQCPAVVKQHQAVAQQAPPLPGMVCDDPDRAATWRRSIRAPRPVPAFAFQARRLSPASAAGSRMWPTVSSRSAARCKVSSSRGQSGSIGTEPGTEIRTRPRSRTRFSSPCRAASARELVVTLDTVKGMWATSWQARRGQPHRVRGPGPRTEPHPWSRAVATPAGSLHSHEGQAPTPGQVAP
jgi:hypothetical protein